MTSPSATVLSHMVLLVLAALLLAAPSSSSLHGVAVLHQPILAFCSGHSSAAVTSGETRPRHRNGKAVARRLLATTIGQSGTGTAVPPPSPRAPMPTTQGSTMEHQSPPLSHEMEIQKTQNVPITLIIAIASGVVSAIITLVLIWHRRRNQPVQIRHVIEPDNMQGKKMYDQDQEDEQLGMEEEEEDIDGEITSCQSYSYHVLEAATCHFSNRNKLGSGGFGTVYKGTLENGKEVAVKKLRDSKRNQQELEKEIYMVANLCHKNLVRFLGYCLEDEGKFLVYEYISNNSLEKFWYKACFHPEKLEWVAWFNIIKGVARGLRFLHSKGVIHRDLKPHNVLLDENFNPKIADFDLMRTYDKEKTHESTEMIAGTL